MLGISVDTFASAGAFARSLDLGFPLLGDWPEFAVSRAYGVFNEERKVNRRVTFVVDGDGVIRHIVDDPRDFERHAREALEAVRRLAAADRP